MNYLKSMLPIYAVLVLLFVTSISSAFAFSFGPPEEKTGAPNEGTCADAGCHTGNDLNASGGSLILTAPETYQPGGVYEIIVNLARAGQSRWGFEMTALDGDGASAGSFEVSDAANTQLKVANSKQYIMHTAAGSAQGTNDENQWTLKWTAPDADIGPITFYAAGNAADGNFIFTGDYIYTTQAESTPPVPVVVGVNFIGNVEQTTMDAVTGVDYTFELTNMGNMSDTFTLEVSVSTPAAEAGLVGALSVDTITLEPDATQEITFNVTGNAATSPGAYDIEVSAISGADSLIRSTLLTTTTIEMPPPPPTPWDVNDDGIVNVQDLVLVASEFGQSGEALEGDINGDGTVNVLDLVLVSSHFGENTKAGQ
ncbi:MAG: hypothetical protein OXG97_17710 [Candidatus Poribacteria bacterium]|nr:hypothetical protein [Candidatus Poribacteria bacterium]